MAVQGNKSDGKTSVGPKLYTGLANVNVVGINPTKEQAEKFGYKMKDEPVYMGKDKNEVDYTRIDFFLKHKQIGLITKYSVFLRKEGRESSKTPGNKQFVNDYGQFAWGTTPEEILEKYDWIKPDGLKLATAGEEDLINFMKKWLDVTDGKITIDHMDKLLKGDVSELQGYMKQFPDNQVKVLLMVKDQQYQEVYSAHFGRPYDDSTRFWKEALIKKAIPTGRSTQDDLELKPYKAPTSLGAPVEKTQGSSQFSEEAF